MTRVVVKQITMPLEPTEAEHNRMRAIRNTRRTRKYGDVTKQAVIDPASDTIVLADKEFTDDDLPF